MCSHVLDGTALVCTRTTRHDETATGGHVYQAAWAADRHDKTEATDD